MRASLALALIAGLVGCRFGSVCGAGAGPDIADLAVLRARLEDQERAERRESDAASLRAFVRVPGHAALLEGLAVSPDRRERDLGRFALAADAEVARAIYARFVRSPNSSVRLQASLVLDPWPPHVLDSPLTCVETGTWTDHVHIGHRDLDGNGHAESLRCVHFSGADGQHQRLEILDDGRRVLGAITAVDGSVRFVSLERGTLGILVSDIYAEGSCGRATAWVGVVAIEHRLYEWTGSVLALRDRFFTPFASAYP